MASYGIVKKNSPLYVQKDNQERIKQLIADLEMLDTPLEKAAYQKIFNDSKELSDYAVDKYRQTIMSSEELQNRLLSEYRKFDPEADLETAISQTGRAFGGHISHIYRIDDFAGPNKNFKRGMKGMGTISNMLRVNFGIENLGLQKTAENVLDANIQAMNRAFKKGDMEQVNKLANVIKQYDEYLTTKGMAAYRRLSKKSLTPEVIAKLNEVLGKDVAGTIRKIRDVTIDGQKVTGEGEVSAKFNDVLIGSNVPQTVTDQKMRMDNLMAYFLENPQALKIDLRNPQNKQMIIDTMPETPYSRKGFLNLGTKDIIQNSGFKKGGPVKMAKGGLDSVLENMNQQNFTPDPAIDGDSAFQQAVKSGNLTAFNIPKVFKTLGDTFGVFTPKRASAPTSTAAEGVDAGTALGAPPGQTLPATKPLQSEDFVFESFTLDKINSPTAPKAAKPQDWINYLQGGKDKAPSAELLDSGLFQYMTDFEKFFPNQKMTKQQIVELYEQSPIANLKIKIKSMGNAPSPYEDAQQVMGTTRHKNAGNAQIDAGGTDYREIVLEAGALPGEQKPYVNSTHFNEDNVLVFSRVANYDNKAGEQVAVIQELQTDLLTKVRKEQERLNSIIENKKLQVQRNNDIIQDPNRDNYDKSMAEQNLTRLVPELNQLEKVKETNLIITLPDDCSEGFDSYVSKTIKRRATRN